MKLAELLLERKDLQAKLRQLSGTMNTTINSAEGEAVNEEPNLILHEFIHINEKLRELMTQISLINSKVIIESLGVTITHAVEQREACRRQFKFIDQTIKNAEQRISQQYMENRSAVVIDLKHYYNLRDGLAHEIRTLDIAIQQCNWNLEI